MTAKIAKIFLETYAAQEIPFCGGGSFQVIPGFEKGQYYCDYEHTGLGLRQDMMIDLNNKTSSCGYIEVKDKRKGWGKKLVRARESFCKTLGIEKIIISPTIKESKPFWQTLGYTGKEIIL